MAFVDWLSLGAAVASTGAAIAAWRAARMANSIAGKVARLETARWHFEMTPKLSGRIVDGTDGPMIEVRLDEPVALAHLNAVTLEIVDERPDVDAGGAVLGPYCFAGTADPAGRRVGPFPLAVGERRWFELQAPGQGAQQIGIRLAMSAGGVKPMRLQVTCSHEDFNRPWNVPLTVPVEFSSGLVTDETASGS